MDRMVIAGRMEEGRVFVPGAELDLEDVKGQALIAKGVLEGEGLEARYGNGKGEKGTLKLGFQGEHAPFHLDMEVEADLALVPPVLRRLVKSSAFLSALDKTREVQGRARGRLLLGEKTSQIRARVEAHEFDLSARYEGIPHALKVAGGHFLYQGEAMSFKDLKCRMGKSSVGNLSGRIEWKDEPTLVKEARDVIVSLDEIFPWLSSAGSFREGLKVIHSLGGELLLHESHAEGPLLKPEQWKFETKGEVLDLKGRVESLSGVVGIPKGRFTADQKKLFLKDVETRFLDTSLTVSGSLDGPMESLRRADLTFQGEVGPRTLGELSRSAGGTWAVTTQKPVSMEPMAMVWDRDLGLGLKGNLRVGKGLLISLDAARRNGQWALNRAHIKDDVSDAVLSLTLQDRVLVTSFSGRLSERTLDKIFPGYQFEEGWVEGDFRLNADLERPFQSHAEGRLDADDFSLIMDLSARFEIDRIALSAKGREVFVESVAWVWAETKFTAAGSLKMETEGLTIDLDIFSSKLDWEQIRPYLTARATPLPGGQGKGPAGIPLRGHVRLHADQLTAGGFTWRPLKAQALLNPQRLEAKVTEARVCGVSTPGEVTVTPDDLFFRFEALAAREDVSPSLECLTQGQRKATGTYDLRLDIQGQGKEEELLSSLHGDLAFSARKGTIHENILLERINRYLSLTGIYRDTREHGEGGIPFDAIEVKAKIDKGQCTFEEAVFDGVNLEAGFEGAVDLVRRTIEGRILVAPFRTMDRIVNFIPVVRTVMGGTLVSIPIKVAGPLEDPNLTPLAASEMGRSLVDMMKRTFRLPVEMYDPLIHKREEKP